MLSDWSLLTNDLQLAISREALSRAAISLACQAETLAREMENGLLADQGGPEALRLFAAVLRVSHDPCGPTAGHA